MTSTIERVTALDSDDGRGTGALHLRRSWPRDDGRLLLEYERPDGSTVAGQWFRDAARGVEAAAATPGSCWLETHGVVLQPNGADRRLTRLAGLVAEPGAALVVHRPERRAVVRRPDGRYAKVVPPGNAARILAADRVARAIDVLQMPDLVSADLVAGVLEWAEVPGRSLYELLHDPSVSLAGLADAGAAMGAALRALHLAPVPRGLVRHTAEAETNGAASWVRHTFAHGDMPAPDIDTALDRAATVMSAADSPVAVLHRDLHEKQVVIADDRATLLDFDTLAVGEPALDVANFLVHLDLRAALGLPVERARATALAFVDEYRPSTAVVERIPAHAAVTRIRLACVYAFRPRQAERAARLVTDPLEGSLIAVARHASSVGRQRRS